MRTLKRNFCHCGVFYLNFMNQLVTSKGVSLSPRSEEDSEGNRDICSEILQMKALERLTSTVSVAGSIQHHHLMR